MLKTTFFNQAPKEVLIIDIIVVLRVKTVKQNSLVIVPLCVRLLVPVLISGQLLMISNKSTKFIRKIIRVNISIVLFNQLYMVRYGLELMILKSKIKVLHK